MLVYARGTIHFGFEIDDSSTLQVGETGVALFPFPGFGVNAGWRWTLYEADRDNEIDIDLEFSGPTVGILLQFGGQVARRLFSWLLLRPRSRLASRALSRSMFL